MTMQRHSTDTPRITYFRIEDPTYPRNARIRAFLEARGHCVTVVPAAVDGPRWLRHLRDLARLGRATRRGDVIIVAEQFLRSVPGAARVALVPRCRLVVDGFVGIHETAVEDWGVARPGSLRARRFRLQDFVALRAADCVLIDTDVRAAGLRRSAARPETVVTLPVGAPTWASPTPAAAPSPALRVLYYGNYIPLHGLDIVLHAIAAMQEPVQVTMLGDGARRPSFERLAQQLGLDDRVSFTPSVPEAELADVIAEHDVVLGVFGTSPKASSVIANKTWQGLASGRTVVTMASPALDEISSIAGDRLVQVDVQDEGPRELAAALDALALAGETEPDTDIAARLEGYVRSRFAAFGTWIDGDDR